MLNRRTWTIWTRCRLGSVPGIGPTASFAGYPVLFPGLSMSQPLRLRQWCLPYSAVVMGVLSISVQGGWVVRWIQSRSWIVTLEGVVELQLSLRAPIHPWRPLAVVCLSIIGTARVGVMCVCLDRRGEEGGVRMERMNGKREGTGQVSSGKLKEMKRSADRRRSKKKKKVWCSRDFDF